MESKSDVGLNGPPSPSVDVQPPRGEAKESEVPAALLLKYATEDLERGMLVEYALGATKKLCVIESINDTDPITYNLRWCTDKQAEETFNKTPSIAGPTLTRVKPKSDDQMHYPGVARTKMIESFDKGAAVSTETIVIKRYNSIEKGEKVQVKLYSGNQSDSRCWYNAKVVKSSPSEALGVVYEVNLLDGVDEEVALNEQRFNRRWHLLRRMSIDDAFRYPSPVNKPTSNLKQSAKVAKEQRRSSATKVKIPGSPTSMGRIRRQETHGGSFAGRLTDHLWGKRIYHIPYERIRLMPKPKFYKGQNVEIEFELELQSSASNEALPNKRQDLKDTARTRRNTIWLPGTIEDVNVTSKVAGGITYKVKYSRLKGGKTKGISECTRRRLRRPFRANDTAEYYLSTNELPKNGKNVYKNQKSGWRKCTVVNVRGSATAFKIPGV